jgi:hypothetical protein
MRYSVKKFARDLAVAAVGFVAYTVASVPVDQLPDVGVSEGVIGIVPVILNFVYREARDNSDLLYDLDQPGH